MYGTQLTCLSHFRPDDFVIATGETHSVREFVEESFKVRCHFTAEVADIVTVCLIIRDSRLYRSSASASSGRALATRRSARTLPRARSSLPLIPSAQFLFSVLYLGFFFFYPFHSSFIFQTQSVQVLPPHGGRVAARQPRQGREGPRLEAQDHLQGTK